MWRAARADEDEAIVEMCLAYYREDPGLPVAGEQVRRTLHVLRHEPQRGRAVVLEVAGRLAGYALLISFWSNELGGEICEVDELFVMPDFRNRGSGSALFSAIERGEIWGDSAVSIELGVTRDNVRARRLYERLGFSVTNGTGMRRMLRR
jgi:GNAT superfamily N-acetyltransferase